jgi:hypothetical protein
LWLYGPVPPGFWELAENRQRYVQWLGEQLGFTTLEDWYRITRRHFQCHRGGEPRKRHQEGYSSWCDSHTLEGKGDSHAVECLF